MNGLTDEPSTTIRVERTVRARAHDVFDAWTSVEVLRRWWHAEHAWETPHAELDLRVGGALRITMPRPTTRPGPRRRRPVHRDRPAAAARVHMDLGRRPVETAADRG